MKKIISIISLLLIIGCSNKTPLPKNDFNSMYLPPVGTTKDKVEKIYGPAVFVPANPKQPADKWVHTVLPDICLNVRYDNSKVVTAEFYFTKVKIRPSMELVADEEDEDGLMEHDLQVIMEGEKKIKDHFGILNWKE